MTIDFVKMEGTGNDFIVVDVRDDLAGEYRWLELAVRWCDRHFGIGADGLLLVHHSERADVRMRILNPDGSEAEMCGNGIRCLAKFLVDSGRHASPDNRLEVETVAGVKSLEYTQGADGGTLVIVNMGPPILDPAAIPVSPTVDIGEKEPARISLNVDGVGLTATLISMGNPHAVAFVDEPVSEFPLDRIGPLVEQNDAFPSRTNFEVARRRDDGIEMRVWERGVGETMACGTGVCAVAVANRLSVDGTGSQRVHLPGGTVIVDWDGSGDVFLTGPAKEVYRGTIDI